MSIALCLACRGRHRDVVPRYAASDLSTRDLVGAQSVWRVEGSICVHRAGNARARLMASGIAIRLGVFNLPGMQPHLSERPACGAAVMAVLAADVFRPSAAHSFAQWFHLPPQKRRTCGQFHQQDDEERDKKYTTGQDHAVGRARLRRHRERQRPMVVTDLIASATPATALLCNQYCSCRPGVSPRANWSPP